MAVLKIARIVTARHQALCLVRNISAGGVMIQSAAPLAMADPIALDFNTNFIVHGHVAWIAEGAAGIAFAHPVDVAAVLAPGADDRDPSFANRSPRLEIDCSASINRASETHVVELVDVSQGGAKIATSLALARHERVIVSIDGLPPRAARICWSASGVAGTAFNLPIPFDLLASWALQQKPRATLVDIG